MDIITKWRFGLKKSAPCASCNLLALSVPFRLFPQHSIPAARRWIGYPSGLGTAFLHRRSRVGYSSHRLNSGWGFFVVLHVLRAALAFIVGFYCCPWSSLFYEDAFLREGCGCGIYKWVSERNACWLSRGPMFHSTGARLRFFYRWVSERSACWLT